MSIDALLTIHDRVNKALETNRKRNADALQAVLDGPARAVEAFHKQMTVLDAIGSQVAKSLTQFPSPPLDPQDRKIRRLERELTAKDDTITALRQQISQQDQLLTALAHVSEWEL